jgi:hypothetical protein
VAPVLQQDPGGFPDPLLVQLACGHVVQHGNIGDNLLGVVVFTRDGHCHLPCSGQNYAIFVQRQQSLPGTPLSVGTLPNAVP